MGIAKSILPSSNKLRGSRAKRKSMATADAPPRLSNRVLAVAGAALGIVTAAVVFAPASWLAYAVSAATHGRVQLVNPLGTVWEGSAALELTGGEGASSALGLPSRIHWQLHPKWSGVQAVLQAACCVRSPVVAQISARTLHLQAGSFTLPMGWMQGLGAPWNTLRLRGQLHVQWQPLQLAWSDPLHSLQGEVHMQARQVATSLSTLPCIGSYRLHLVGGSEPKLTLSTQEGALRVQGTGVWEGGRLRFAGQAQAEPARAMELANLLTLLGRQQGGITIIRWDGV